MDETDVGQYEYHECCAHVDILMEELGQSQRKLNSLPVEIPKKSTFLLVTLFFWVSNVLRATANATDGWGGYYSDKAKKDMNGQVRSEMEEIADALGN